MTRRTTAFLAGGAVMIAVGALLAAGLWWARAGWEFVQVWLAAAIAIGLGGFWIQVGRDARRFAREYLDAAEEGRPLPPGGPPP